MKIHLSYESDQEHDTFLDAMATMPAEWQLNARIKDNGKKDKRGRKHLYLLITKKKKAQP